MYHNTVTVSKDSDTEISLEEGGVVILPTMCRLDGGKINQGQLQDIEPGKNVKKMIPISEIRQLRGKLICGQTIMRNVEF